MLKTYTYPQMLARHQAGLVAPEQWHVWIGVESFRRFVSENT
jgi:hypothetical protein